MNYLLDTHTLIWFLEGVAELSQTSLEAIEKEGSNCFVSIASIWEIAIKISINKLEMKTSFEKLNQLIWQNSFELIPIRFEHTKELLKLPFHHKDPFDRIIISQAIIENLTIISKDNNFTFYDINCLW